MDKDLQKVEEYRKTDQVKGFVKRVHDIIDENTRKYVKGADEQEQFHNMMNLFQAVVEEAEIGPEDNMTRRILANGMAMGYLLGKKEN